jgi:hypothetical protein
MHVEAGVAEQPALDLRGLVRRGVIEHDVDVEVLGHGVLDHVQEAAELLCAVAGAHLADELPGSDVQGGVEVCGSVAHVVMGRAFGHRRAPLRQALQ